jgi:phenylacetate-coenzyme A ligase PaaK-like adenylate-forming protein
MQQLSKHLHHAYANVPYYRKVFDERELHPRDIQTFDDLKKLPYLTVLERRCGLLGFPSYGYSENTQIELF